jgi:hypothetical protein
MERTIMMGNLKEQLDYEEKADRIQDYLEELILDAMMSALDKIIRRTWIIEFPSSNEEKEKF